MFTSVCESEAARKRLIFARKVRARTQSVKSPTPVESNEQRRNLARSEVRSWIASAQLMARPLLCIIFA